MARKVLDKCLSFLGFEVEEIEEYVEPEDEYAAQDWKEIKRHKKSNVVSLQSVQKPVKLVLLSPQTYDEVQEVADYLKNRCPVIVNLEQTEKEVAQRIVDFLSGTIYALGGTTQKVSAAIVLFAPANFDVAGQLDANLTDKHLFSFINSFSG